MTIVLTTIARFLVRLAFTVVWALILSKLIRSAWSLAKRMTCKVCNKITTAEA